MSVNFDVIQENFTLKLEIPFNEEKKELEFTFIAISYKDYRLIENAFFRFQKAGFNYRKSIDVMEKEESIKEKENFFNKSQDNLKHLWARVVNDYYLPIGELKEKKEEILKTLTSEVRLNGEPIWFVFLSKFFIGLNELNEDKIKKNFSYF